MGNGKTPKGLGIQLSCYVTSDCSMARLLSGTGGHKLPKPSHIPNCEKLVGKALRHAAMRQLKEGSSRHGDTMNQGKRMWNILFVPPTSIPFSATLASILALSGCLCESV